MADDESEVSFELYSEEAEDLVAPLRPSGRPSNVTEASTESEPDPLLSNLNISEANSWQDVDREELSQTVLKLISSVASTAPTDDKSRDAVWHPTTTLTISQDLFNDPLGFGTIDLVNMRLERPGADNDEGAQHKGTAAPSPFAPHSSKAFDAARPKGRRAQAKGVVGRFFSELTRHNSIGDAALARQPSVSAALAAAGLDRLAVNPLASPHSRARVRASLDGRREGQGSGALAGGLQAKLLPCEEGFDPEAYLAIFHEKSSSAELASGLRALERELGERTGQLKQLVKQNFDRFISCKTTIDDIYVKLQHIESTKTGISTEILFNAIQEVQAGASTVLGPILERSAKAERIRSVQLLMRRFQGLFSAPQRIRGLAAARDYEQVTAEFKKATALIKPGPKTSKVWADLYAEIDKRVAEVYQQLQTEIQDPQLPAAAAAELVRHMLQLQAEGLAVAQGQDPLALLLAAREEQFAAAMQAVASEHERAVNRLRAAVAAAATDEKMQDPAALTEAQLLQWRGGLDAPCSSGQTSLAFIGVGGSRAAGTAGGASTVFARSFTGYRGSSAAAAAAAVQGALEDDLGLGLRGLAGGVLGGLPGSRHLAEVAPLSGLQPPAPRSRLVQDTRCTAGELLYLRNLQRQSEVLLECLPGLWQTAGANKLQVPVNLPASAAARLQQTLAGAADILQRLVDNYCREVGGVVAALSSVGPLREALVAAAEDLAYTLQQLQAQQAPAPALAAVQAVLGRLVAAGVQQLVGHLLSVPSWLVSREGWQLSLTHSGSQPITMMPGQLQEEVTAAMQYYQQLLGCSTGSPTGSINALAAAKIITQDKSTKPIRDAYFTCLEDTIKTCKAAAEVLRPVAKGSSAAAGAAAGGSSTATAAREGGSPQRGRHGMSAAAAAAVLGPDTLFDDVETAAAAAAGVDAGLGKLLPGGGAAAGLGPGSLSDDVRLLLMSSNLSFMRERLVGGLTQRFLLVLTGEVPAEVERCSRYVVKLASRLDTAIQMVHGVYLERKRRSIDRLLANYIQPDGQPVGVPPELRDVTPHAAQLVQLVAAVQSETFTYARPFMQQLLHAALEHIGSAMSSAFASLPTATAGPATSNGTAAAAAAAGCPIEALGQYFMDLVYLDAILSKAGPQSLSVDVAAAYQLLATRMCAAGGGSRSAEAETTLARSLQAIKDPQELSRKLQVTCRKALRDVLERSSFTVHSLLGTSATAGAGAGTGGAGGGS